MTGENTVTVSIPSKYLESNRWDVVGRAFQILEAKFSEAFKNTNCKFDGLVTAMFKAYGVTNMKNPTELTKLKSDDKDTVVLCSEDKCWIENKQMTLFNPN